MKAMNKSFALNLVVASLLFVSCDSMLNGNKQSEIPELEDSLEPIEEVILIEGAENSILTVNMNRNKEAYFSIQLDNIESNGIIDNSEYDAWCIDVWKKIDSNNGSYQNIELYSTYLVRQWKPVNYLLNIQQELQSQDPELTWLEIQLAIWTLRKYPEFDLESVALKDLPGQFRNGDQPTFKAEKVKEILNLVEANYRDFDYDRKGTKFAVVAKMPLEVQTVIMIVENN